MGGKEEGQRPEDPKASQLPDSPTPKSQPPRFPGPLASAAWPQAGPGILQAASRGQRWLREAQAASQEGKEAERSGERMLPLPQKRRRPQRLPDPGPDFLRPSPITLRRGGGMGCEAGKGKEGKEREARKWEGSLRGGVRLAVTFPCTLARGLRWTPQPRVTDRTRPRTHTRAQRFHAHTYANGPWLTRKYVHRPHADFTRCVQVRLDLGEIQFPPGPRSRVRALTHTEVQVLYLQ